MSAARRNISLVIAYDGTDFSGWQRQRGTATIQEEIEKRLSLMSAEPIQLHGAGRTDAGVHAEGMVAHFHTTAKISDDAFLRGLNAMLPGTIRIVAANEAASDFHARFSAIGKEYQYRLYCGRVLPPHLCRYRLHVSAPLDLAVIRSCLQLLHGRHDFSSFENSGTRDKETPGGRGAVRTIHQAEIITRNPEQPVLRFIGDGFLRNMVRNLVGTVLEAGRGRLGAVDFAAILAAKDRKTAGPTAPARGLTLQRVLY